MSALRAPKAVAKSIHTRTRILDAAAHVLSHQGYAAMRISMVADRAFLQPPSIYYYFAGRDELVEEVIRAGVADLREHVVAVLDAAPARMTPMERIVLAAETHVRHALEIPDYARASIRNAGQLPDPVRRAQLREEATYGEVWHELLEDAAAAGALNPALDLFVARMLVLGALSWTAEWWSPEQESLGSVVSTASGFVRDSLARS